VVAVEQPFTFLVRPYIQQYMPKTRKHSQDKKRVNRNEHYEVEYMARTRNASKGELKEASKKAGPMRKNVDRALKRGWKAA
jgi:hypothetical protein